MQVLCKDVLLPCLTSLADLLDLRLAQKKIQACYPRLFRGGKLASEEEVQTTLDSIVVGYLHVSLRRRFSPNSRRLALKSSLSLTRVSQRTARREASQYSPWQFHMTWCRLPRRIHCFQISFLPSSQLYNLSMVSMLVSTSSCIFSFLRTRPMALQTSTQIW